MTAVRTLAFAAMLAGCGRAVSADGAPDIAFETSTDAVVDAVDSTTDDSDAMIPSDAPEDLPAWEIPPPPDGSECQVGLYGRFQCEQRYRTPDDPFVNGTCCAGRCIPGTVCGVDGGRAAQCGREPTCDLDAGMLCCGQTSKTFRCVRARTGSCKS